MPTDTEGNGKLIFRVGFATDTGRRRRVNQDSFSIFVPYPGSEAESEFQAVMGVADGMGGHQAGDLASRKITEYLNRAFIQGEYRDRHPEGAELLQVMKSEVNAVHRELYTMAKRSPDMKELGSTLTFGIFSEGLLYLAHVGDSRCYRLRDGLLEQLTQDHSWVAEGVRSGLLSEEESRHHPKNNVLTQAMGFDPVIEPQMLKLPVREGDFFLFCSDGLTNMLENEDIVAVIRENPNPQRACDRLVEAANEKGGLDNITAVIGEATRPLSKTREAEVEGPFAEYAQENRSGWKKKLLIGSLAVVLAGGGFFGGMAVRSCSTGKRVDRLIERSRNLIRSGENQQAEDLLRAVLEISPRNQKALELMNQIQNRN